MARFFNVALCLAAFVVAVSAQFDYFGGYPGGFGAAGPRDARDNRGPVTFPVTSGGSETSGVRIGASGYGFVPPSGRGGHKYLPMKMHPLATTNKNANKLKNIEDWFSKAEHNLRRKHEQASPKIVIPKLEKEQAKEALKQAKEILDASLLDAEHKVMVILKEGRLEQEKQ